MDHFIDVLKDDISIVKELPEDFSWSTRTYYATRIRATRIKNAPVHASANWYHENVLPILERLVCSSALCFAKLNFFFKLSDLLSFDCIVYQLI